MKEEFSNLPQFHLMPLFPYIVMALTGMVGLVIHMVKPKGSSKSLFFATLIGIFIALVGQIGLFGNEYLELSEMISKNNMGMVGEAIILVSTFIVVLISHPYFIRTKTYHPEFFPLITWSALGGMIMCSSDNMLTIFVGLELLSISLYVMAGMNKRSKFSQEAAIKYFLLGAFATGFFLYGVAFMYGASGKLGLESFVAYGTHSAHPENRPMLALAFILIAVGLSFKCGVAPFHQWIPEVYSGAPTNVTAFMATAAKVGPFIAFYNLVHSMGMFTGIAFPVCAGLGILSMTVGNVMAFTQKDVKKLLAYSSVANAGYIVLYFGSLIISEGSHGLILLYFLLAYVFATLGVFVILAFATRDGNENPTLDSLRGLSKRHPGLAALLVVFVLSQIGIGPVAGFVGKVLIINDLVKFNHLWSAVILLANSALAAFYYFKLIKAAYTDSDENEVLKYEVSASMSAALGICAFVVVGAVVFYPTLMRFLSNQ
jgi:NADH-quinone oxidoreductase subunit N